MLSDTATSTIEIAHVVKRFRKETAVADLSLSVKEGEIFAFLGPNGAGKTTTIKMIIGLLAPDSGSVHVCGYDMRRGGHIARSRVAYVPDQPFLYDKLTGREFLNFVREMYRVPRPLAAERVQEYAERLGMHDFMDRLCETYSHGMKQKMVLSAALLHDPELLVVDEPMVGLDPGTARVVKDLFLERARAGRTVFMSTHTMSVAEAVAHRVGIIHNGRLITLGTVAELQQAERHGSLEEVFLALTSNADGSHEGVPVEEQV
jgi:ABC-2 type transport system ATP-binding protein